MSARHVKKPRLCRTCGKKLTMTADELAAHARKCRATAHQRR